MKILQECKRFLSYAGLGSEHDVPRTISRAVVISVLTLLSTLHLINSIKNYDIGLQAVLFPAHCFLLGCMKMAIYFALIWKTTEIARLIDYIEMVVKRRRFLQTFFFLSSPKARMNGTTKISLLSITNRVQTSQRFIHHL